MKVSYANTVSTIALLVVITGVAPVDAARSMLTGRDIKDNSIQSADLANLGVKSIDIASGGVTSSDVLNGSIHAIDLSPALRARIDQAFTRVDYGGEVVVVNAAGDKTSTCPAGTLAIGGAFTASDDNYPYKSTYSGTNAWTFGGKRPPTTSGGLPGFGSMPGRAICLGR